MRLLRRLVLTALAAAAGIIAGAGPAQSLSCVDPASIAAGVDTVFAGRITDARDQRILVDVREIWKGGPIDDQVWLYLDPGLEGWWDELPDHTFSDGYASEGLWVFMPRTAGARLVVNTCTAGTLTGPWRMPLERPVGIVTLPDIAAGQPTASPAVPTSDDDAGDAWLIGGSAAGALLTGSLACLALRRRSQPSA